MIRRPMLLALLPSGSEASARASGHVALRGDFGPRPEPATPRAGPPARLLSGLTGEASPPEEGEHEQDDDDDYEDGP
jgi:hypothetical protein